MVAQISLNGQQFHKCFTVMIMLALPRIVMLQPEVVLNGAGGVIKAMVRDVVDTNELCAHIASGTHQQCCCCCPECPQLCLRHDETRCTCAPADTDELVIPARADTASDAYGPCHRYVAAPGVPSDGVQTSTKDPRPHGC